MIAAAPSICVTFAKQLLATFRMHEESAEEWKIFPRVAPNLTLREPAYHLHLSLFAE
jgi:hypothetical protein